MFLGWLLTNKLSHSLRDICKIGPVSYSSFYFHAQKPALVVCVVSFETESLPVGKLLNWQLL